MTNYLFNQLKSPLETTLRQKFNEIYNFLSILEILYKFLWCRGSRRWPGTRGNGNPAVMVES